MLPMVHPHHVVANHVGFYVHFKVHDFDPAAVQMKKRGGKPALSFANSGFGTGLWPEHSWRTSKLNASASPVEQQFEYYELSGHRAVPIIEEAHRWCCQVPARLAYPCTVPWAAQAQFSNTAQPMTDLHTEAIGVDCRRTWDRLPSAVPVPDEPVWFASLRRVPTIKLLHQIWLSPNASTVRIPSAVKQNLTSANPQMTYQLWDNANALLLLTVANSDAEFERRITSAAVARSLNGSSEAQALASASGSSAAEQWEHGKAATSSLQMAFEQGYSKWQADLLRFTALGLLGGIYVDADIEVLASFDDIAAEAQGADFISALGPYGPLRGRSEMTIGFMMARRGPEPLLSAWLGAGGAANIAAGPANKLPYAYSIRGVCSLLREWVKQSAATDGFGAFRLMHVNGRTYYLFNEIVDRCPSGHGRCTYLVSRSGRRLANVNSHQYLDRLRNAEKV